MRLRLTRSALIAGTCMGVVLGSTGSATVSLAAPAEEAAAPSETDIGPQPERNALHGEALACAGLVGVTRADAARELARRGYADANWHHSIDNMPQDAAATDQDIVVDVKKIGDEIYAHSVPTGDPWAAERAAERAAC